MASKLLHWNTWMTDSTREKVSKSKTYRFTRYSLAALLILLAITLLLGAWWLTYSTASLVVSNDAPEKITSGAANTFFGEIHRTPSDSLLNSGIAFGILDIILAIAILGSRKQPFNLILVVLGVIFLATTVALIALTYDTVLIVRVFHPATIAGV